VTTVNTTRNLDFIRARGPRFAVIGTVRRNEHQGIYADNAETAETLRQRYEAAGYYQVQVYPPLGSVDLGALGRARADAKATFDEATALLRAGVVRAVEEGRAETEIAATAGVDRMTVRAWAGKGPTRADVEERAETAIADPSSLVVRKRPRRKP
jgi:hypothetical protein